MVAELLAAERLMGRSIGDHGGDPWAKDGDIDASDPAWPRRRGNLGRTSDPRRGVGGVMAAMGGGQGKFVLLFAGLMVLRFFLTSGGGDDSIKRLPRKYREAADAWTNTTFEPGVFAASGYGRQGLVAYSAGLWNHTTRFRKLLKKAGNATAAAVALERLGSRILVLRSALDTSACDALVTASQGAGFEPDPGGAERWGFPGQQTWSVARQGGGEYTDEHVNAFDDLIANITGYVEGTPHLLLSSLWR